MVDPAALDEIDDESIERRLPDRAVVSLRDLEAFYGELYALARAGEGEYAKYLTPDAALDRVDDAEGLITVRVDLSGETPSLVDVEMESYGEKKGDRGIEEVAHSKYESARGVDHSVTHLSGRDNSPEQLAQHAVDRFTRWPTEDAVRETAETHEDGWVIDALAALGEDETAMDDLHDWVTEAVGTDRTALVTVALRFDPDGEFRYPGDVDVLLEAMAARKTEKFKSKNAADDAVGRGTDYVSDAETDVFGVVDDPMKFYLSKQRERFPRFDADESWRTQPLGRDAAIAAQNATTFLDACEYRSAGVTVFYLPYLTEELSVDDARDLYVLLANQTNEGEIGGSGRRATQIEDIYRQLRETHDNPEPLLHRLRFFLLVVEKYQKDRWRLLAGTPDAALLAPVELGETHQDVLDGPAFGDTSGRAAFEHGTSVKYLPHIWPTDDDTGHVGLVSSPAYFTWTFGSRDPEEPSAGDERFRATAEALSGGEIAVETLFAEYVDRLAEELDSDDETDEYGRFDFPVRHVAAQYTQLCTLAYADVLTSERASTHAPEQFIPAYMTDETTGDESPPNRVEKLEQFIDDHGMLSGEDNAERRGVFVLGALVGRVSRHQKRQDKSMTAVRSHPVDGLTKHNVQRTATEVVSKNVIYSDEEGYKGTMYGELMQQVADDLQHRPADDWTLSTDDLRFHYALGIAYGLNDQTTLHHEEDDD